MLMLLPLYRTQRLPYLSVRAYFLFYEYPPRGSEMPGIFPLGLFQLSAASVCDVDEVIIRAYHNINPVLLSVAPRQSLDRRPGPNPVISHTLIHFQF